MFVAGKHVEPSLLNASWVGAYSSGASFSAPLRGKDYKYWAKLYNINNNKRSSLVQITQKAFKRISSSGEKLRKFKSGCERLGSVPKNFLNW